MAKSLSKFMAVFLSPEMNLELISDLWGCYLSRLNRQLQPCDVTSMLDLMKAAENCKPANTIGSIGVPVEEEPVRPDTSKLSTQECIEISSTAHVLYGYNEAYKWPPVDYRLIVDAIMHPHARSYGELQHLIKLSTQI